MKLIFAGTPQFALPILHMLHKHHDVALVITQTPHKANRGQRETPSPVHEYAITENLRVSTDPINTLEDTLRACAPECIVVASYGGLLAPNILAIPKKGVINVHPSLLPKYRGASPLQAALLAGDTETGVTLVQMVAKMDAGPIIAQVRRPISKDETAGTLHDTLALLGSELLRDVLVSEDEQQWTPTPQNEKQATYTYKIKSEDARIRLDEPVLAIERKIRAYNPWPGAYLGVENPHIGTKRLKIFRAQIKINPPHLSSENRYEPFHVIEGGLFLKTECGEYLHLIEVQPEGKKRMRGEEFMRGYFSRKP